MLFLKSLLAFVLVLAGSAPVCAQQTELPLGKFVVATRHVPPFAIKDTDGNWNGIAIDLLKEIVVELNEESETEIEAEFREMTLKEMLLAVERGDVDLAAAALTVNFERESKMDFSHPFHTSGLGIAVATGQA